MWLGGFRRIYPSTNCMSMNTSDDITPHFMKVDIPDELFIMSIALTLKMTPYTHTPPPPAKTPLCRLTPADPCMSLDMPHAIRPLFSMVNIFKSGCKHTDSTLQLLNSSSMEKENAILWLQDHNLTDHHVNGENLKQSVSNQLFNNFSSITDTTSHLPWKLQKLKTVIPQIKCGIIIANAQGKIYS